MEPRRINTNASEERLNPEPSEIRVIADLDGTLSRVNTFTLFVKEFFRGIPKARLPLGGIVVLRKLRVITHWEAKRRILSLFERYGSEKIIEVTIEKILRNLNPEVEKAVRDNPRAMLATAAPALYANPLALRIGIPYAVATPDAGPECKGEEKVRRIRQLGVPFTGDTLVFTDHDDDMPLMRANACGTNIMIKNE